MLKSVAVFTGDVHLTEKTPLARKGESDWMEAQHRVINWLYGIADGYKCPVVIGGDLFDKVSPSYQFLNTVYNWFESHETHVLLGNHEQPNKTDTGLDGSAWLTACRMKMFEGYSESCVSVGEYVSIGYIPATNDDRVFMDAVDYMSTIKPRIIVLHKYVWGNDMSSSFADMNSNADTIAKHFPYAEYIFASDNHHGFRQGKVCNCGMLIRDNADLIDYKPRVYFLGYDTELDKCVVETVYVPEDLLAMDVISNAHIVSAKNDKEAEKLFIKTVAESKANTVSFEDNLHQRLQNQRSAEYVLNKYKEIEL